MWKILGCSVLVALVILLASPVPSQARSHVVFGANIWLGPGFWGPGWWWGSPYYYSPPPVVVQPAPTYVQPAPPVQEPYYWYYCQTPQGYYPYVQQCPNGWMKVVPPATAPGP